VSDFLEEKHREITDRLKELQPVVDEYNREYNRLKDAASALAKVIGSAASEATSAVAATVTHRRKRGRPRRSGGKTAAAETTAPAKKRGRPPGRRKKAMRPKTKKVGRPPGSTSKVAAATATAAPKTATKAKRRAGRRKGGGQRAAQALSLVKGQPGITIPELAAKMGIKGTYLYKILPPLEQEGKIRKKGHGWHPPER